MLLFQTSEAPFHSDPGEGRHGICMVTKIDDIEVNILVS